MLVKARATQARARATGLFHGRFCSVPIAGQLPMPLTTEDLALPALRARYAAGGTPSALCHELLPALAASRGVFVSMPGDDEVLERCR